MRPFSEGVAPLQAAPPGEGIPAPHAQGLFPHEA